MNNEIAIVIVTITSIVFGYLSGSVLYSVLIGKLFYKKDLRDFESKNAGATNSLRVYGKKTAICILFLDILKSFLPTVILWLIFSNTMDEFMNPDYFNTYSLIYLTGLFAVIGHCFPIFYKFKGGKGASSYGGFVLSVFPFAGIVCLITFIIILKISKYVSLSSIITSWLPIVLVFAPGINYAFILDQGLDTFLVLNGGLYTAIFIDGLFIITAIILTYKHKSNIDRLLKGIERKATKKINK